MVLRVNYSQSATLGLLNLTRVDRSLTSIIGQMSSGERLVHASDDPASMSLADGMRYHGTILAQAGSNAEEAVALLQTAEGAMDEQSALLIRMRELAVNAANAAAHDPSSLAALQGELDQAVASVTGIATRTSFGGRPLLDGSFAGLAVADASRAGWSAARVDQTRLPGGIADGSTVSLGAPSAATLSHETLTIATTAGTADTTPIQGLDFGGGVLDAVDGKQIAIRGPLGSATLTLSSATTIRDAVALVNAYSARTGVTAAYDQAAGSLALTASGWGKGALGVQAQAMSSTLATGLFDSDTTSVANPLEAPRDAFAMTLATGLGGVPPATAAISTLTDGVAGPPLDLAAGATLTLYGRGTSAAYPMTAGTTIQDVVDWANAQGATVGSRASYDALTGALRIEGADGPLSLASTTMSSAGTIGLLDRDTTSPASTNGTQVSSLGAATMTVGFTDAGGTARTVTLVQQPGGDGLTFTNPLPGPEVAPPYSGWQAGAFRVSLKDTSLGSATLTTPTGAGSATRTASTRVQLGGASANALLIDLPDLRGGALGRSAGLASQGLASLQDLVDRKALTGGRAQEAISVIDAAIDELNTARGRAGALQSQGVEAAQTSLAMARDNLTDAESRLRDTDMAAASTEFTRLNILMQAATAMLAQANQTPQSVLQLLQQSR